MDDKNIEILDGVDYSWRKNETDEQRAERIRREYFAIHGENPPTRSDLSDEMKAVFDKLAKG